jgi:hypothetical protein
MNLNHINAEIVLSLFMLDKADYGSDWRMALSIVEFLRYSDCYDNSYSWIVSKINTLRQLEEISLIEKNNNRKI